MNFKFDVQKLIDMLSVRRPAFSSSEEDFVEAYILSHDDAEIDDFGNVKIEVGQNNKILFSCHTDTCERRSGTRKLVYVDDFNYMRSMGAEILGADDGAGVFLLLSMIERGIPGRYVFHRAEEVGALGSSHVVEFTREWLEGIKYAIAFDRKGTHDVVHTQLGRRMASVDTVCNIMHEMGRLGGLHVPAVGIFTDTAIYADDVKECLNISVGYQNEHTANEYLDLEYFDWLYGAVADFDWSILS